jgi:hypothetical protein
MATEREGGGKRQQEKEREIKERERERERASQRERDSTHARAFLKHKSEHHAYMQVWHSRKVKIARMLTQRDR